jgi:hypothetical protein
MIFNLSFFRNGKKNIAHNPQRQHRMEILFWLRYNKKDKTAPATIYCRITYEGERSDGDFSTHIKVYPALWNAKAQLIIPPDNDDTADPNIEADNETLRQIKADIKEIKNERIQEGKPITATILKNSYLGKLTEHITFKDMCKKLYEQKLIRERRKSTLKTNNTYFKNIFAFLEFHKIMDILPDFLRSLFPDRSIPHCCL